MSAPAHNPPAPPPFPSAPDETVAFFLNAYRQGAFPMAEPALTVRGTPRLRRRIDWYIPDPRAVILIDRPINSPGGFHISRSLSRRLRNQPFHLRSDTAFEQVITACSIPTPGREDSWLDDRLIAAYTALHNAGHAHSVEAWLTPDSTGKPILVGGVYGVVIGSVFCAESMFCRPELGGTDASKVCLAYLVQHLQEREFSLLDVQIANRHTAQFGVAELPGGDYLRHLLQAQIHRRSWGTLNPNWRIGSGSAEVAFGKVRPK